MKVRLVFAHFRIEVSVSFYIYVYLCTTVLVGKTVVQSVTHKVLVTGRDALPLSYRRLVGAKASKLGSRDKHPAYC